MILTIITALVFFVSLILVLALEDNYSHENLYMVSMVFLVLSSITLFIMLLIIGAEHAFADRMLAKLQAEREAIVYQMEHNLFLGDALGEFNKKIVGWKMVYESPWTSWFQGDYILQIDPISLK